VRFVLSPSASVSTRLQSAKEPKPSAAGADIAKPYIRFERFFAHDDFYVERFQNLVTGENIFVDFLTSDWFANLPINDRIAVTSLFRRVENSDNIALALSRRPIARENLETLKNLDQDSLPQYLFIKQEPHYSAGQSRLFNSQKVLISAPADFFGFMRTIFSKAYSAIRAGVGLFIGLIIAIIILPFTLFWSFGLKGKINTAITSAAARLKLALQTSLKSSPASISNNLRKYEMNYGNDNRAIQALTNQFEASNSKSVLTKSFLESIPIEHRVFVTSLLRKASKLTTAGSKTFDPDYRYLSSAKERIASV